MENIVRTKEKDVSVNEMKNSGEFNLPENLKLDLSKPVLLEWKMTKKQAKEREKLYKRFPWLNRYYK